LVLFWGGLVFWAVGLVGLVLVLLVVV